MADESKSLLFDLGVNLTDIKTLNQQMTLLRTQMDALVQQKNKGIVGDLQYEQKVLEFKQKEAALERQIAELRSQSISQQNKEANKAAEISAKQAANEEKRYQKYLANVEKQTKAADDAERKLELSRTKAYEKNVRDQLNAAVKQGVEEERIHLETLKKKATADKKATDDFLALGRQTIKKSQDQIEANVQQMAKQEMLAAKTKGSLEYANRKSDLVSAFSNNGFQQMVSLQTQQSKLNALAQSHWQLWKNTGDEIHKIRFNGVQTAIEKVNTQMTAFHNATGSSVGVIDGYMRRVRSHFEWITSGLAIAGIAALPMAFENAAKEAEAFGAKIKQNLELMPAYAENHEKLAEDIKHLQESAGLFAVGYGMKLSEVQEAQQILSRRFKDTATIDYLTNLSAIISKLDAVPMKKAASDLEAVVLQFGLNAQQTSDFVNQFSVAVHSARINGTELLDALMRSGSVFSQFGADTKTAIATVSALATTTARTGSTIGNSFKSILSNLEKDKVKRAFEELGVSIYSIGDNGEKVQKDMDVLFGEIMQKWSSFDQETRNKFGRDWAGTYQLNALSSFMNDAFPIYQKLMDDMGKANNSLTTKLLTEGLDTYAQKLDQLSGAIDVFKVALGDKALPVLKDFTLGLTHGIQWLTLHKEELSNLVSVLVKVAEGYAVYRGAMYLSNIQVAEGITLGSRLATTFGAITVSSAGAATGVRNLSNNVLGLVGTLAAAISRLLVFVAVAEGINRLYQGYSNIKSEEEFLEKVNRPLSLRQVNDGVTQRDLMNEYERAAYDKIQQRNETSRKRSEEVRTTGRTSIGSSEVTKQNEEIQGLIKKVTFASELEDIQKKFSDASKVNLGDHNKDVGTVNIPGLGGKEKGSGSGGAYAPDSSQRINRDMFQRDRNALFLQAKLSADNYAMSLDNVKTKEDLYGTSVSTTIEKITLMRLRIAELTKEQSGYQEKIDDLSTTLDDLVAQNEDFQTMLTTDGLKWSEMTKKQKQEYVEVNKEFLQTHQTISKIIKLMEEYTGKISEAKKEANGLANSITKNTLGKTQDPDYQYQRQQNLLANRIDRELASVDKGKIEYFYDELKVKVNGLREQQALLNKELKRQQEILNNPRTQENPELYQQTSDAVDKLQTQIAQNNAKIKDSAYEAAKSTKEFWAGTVSDMVVKGHSLEDVFKNIFSSIADDAIKALFRIQQKQTTLGTASGGKGKGTTEASTGNTGKGKKAGTTNPTEASGKKGKVGKNAQGSIGNQEQLSMIREGNKREAIIPLEDHKERGRSLWTQAGMELGMFKGTEVVPYMKNPELVKDTAVNVQVQQSEKHIDELRRQNELMMVQNKMIFQMLMNGNNGGTVVQPIIAKQEMSDSEFMAKYDKAQAMGYRR